MFHQKVYCYNRDGLYPHFTLEKGKVVEKSYEDLKENECLIMYSFTQINQIATDQVIYKSDKDLKKLIQLATKQVSYDQDSLKFWREVLS